MQRISWHLVTIAALMALTGCGGAIQPPSGGPGAPAPDAAVERFLQLAGQQEYLQMGWLFGTSDGPVLQRDPPSDVEKRMYALATVLRNQTFYVGAATAVPGRIGAAQQFRVLLRREGREIRVPIIAVRGPGQRWLVEQVDVSAITNQ